LMQAGFLLEILKRCKENNIHTCIDTTGFASNEKLQAIAKKADLFLYDLKLIDDELHQKYTGVPAQQILKNLQWLDAHHENVIIRFPVIPGITDTKQNLSAIKSFIKTLKNIHHLDLLPYHNIQNGKYKRFNKINKMENIQPPTDEVMNRLKSEFESIGFNVGIGG